MPDPLPIQAVHHLGRLTRRLEESRAFYRNVLGFQEIRRPNFDFSGAWLFNYGLQIHLIVNEKLPPPERSAEIQTRANHLALMVSDVEGVERALIEHGIPYRSNRVADTNVRQLFFQDPDGHHIEVGCYPPTPPYLT